MSSVWKRTSQAPDDKWVFGFWRGTCTGQEAKYTHAHGWIDRHKRQVDPPSCWVPLPQRNDMWEPH